MQDTGAGRRYMTKVDKDREKQGRLVQGQLAQGAGTKSPDLRSINNSENTSGVTVEVPNVVVENTGV